MIPVFLHGPLAWPPLFAAVAGQALPDGPAPKAELPDHMILTGADGLMAFPVAAAGHGAGGRLLSCPSAEIVARLTYFCRVWAAVPVETDVMVDGGRHRALAFPGAFPAGDAAPWAESRWVESAGPTLLDATAEIMGYRGGLAPETVAARLPMILSRAASRQAAAPGAPATLRSATAAADIRVTAMDTPHQGFFLTRTYELRHPRFDGTMSAPMRREAFVATDAAIVLPYDPRRDRVLLVEQFRMGPLGRGDPRPWMLEPVAGRIDAGESPETCARRECVDEAGVVLHTLEPVARYYCSPGCSTEYFHCYVGLCDLPEITTGQGGLPGEQEDIRTHVIPFARAMELLAGGEVDNGPLVLSLLWLQRERARLRRAA